MVILHGGILVCAGAEVLFLHRPLIPALAIPMAALFVLSNLLRWWVIRTLAGHWNVEVMESARVGVVSSGPYRWVRHPNYVGVVAELFSLPMIHTAWITAIAGTLAIPGDSAAQAKSRRRCSSRGSWLPPGYGREAQIFSSII